MGEWQQSSVIREVRYPRTEATIAAAISQVSSGSLILGAGIWTIANNLEIPGDISLHIPKGAILSIASGKTVTFDGSLVAGLYQIFAGDGTVAGLSEAYPEWWGVDGTADEVEINKALTAALNVRLTRDSYSTASSINSLRTGSKLSGNSHDRTRIEPATDTFAAIEIASPIRLFSFENFLIDYAPATGGNPSSNPSAVGVNITGNGVCYFAVRNVLINVPYRGFQVTTCAWNYLLERVNVTRAKEYSFHIDPSGLGTTTTLANCGASGGRGGYCITNTNALTMIGCYAEGMVAISDLDQPFYFINCRGSLISPLSEGNTIIKHGIYNFSGCWMSVLYALSINDHLGGAESAVFRTRFEGKITFITPENRNTVSDGDNSHDVRVVMWTDILCYSKAIGENFTPITGPGTKMFFNNSVERSSNLKSNPERIATSGTGEDNLASCLLPAGSLAYEGGISVFAAGTKTGVNGNKIIKLYFGATGFTIHPAANNQNNWHLEAHIFNDWTPGRQKVFWIFYDGIAVTQGYETAEIDTTADVTVKLTGECADAGDVITQELWLVKRD